MRTTVLRATLGAAVVFGLFATSAVPAGAAVDTSRKPQVLVGVGSDATYEVMNDLDQVYNQAPGCAIIPAVGTAFTNYEQQCIDNGQLTYASDYADLIETENLYHDMVVEAYPTGSGNGASTLVQHLLGNPAIDGAFSRSSSKRTITATGYTVYGSAFARDGLGVWTGKNNKAVAVNSAGVAQPAFQFGDLNDVWRGDGSSQCLVNWSKTANDSIAATKVAISSFTATGNGGTIKVYATQQGSGTGKDFASKISGLSLSDASSLKNCIPSNFKDGDFSNGERVIFENNARPVCSQTVGAGTANDASRAIYPYSYARFVQNNAKAGDCPGVLGSVDGIKPSLKTIGDLNPLTGYAVLGRYVYNYFPVPDGVGGFNINDASTWGALSSSQEAVLSYLHPTLGFLCSTSHADDPFTGVNIRTQLESSMKKDGFAPIPSGPVGGSTFSGGSYCRDV